MACVSCIPKTLRQRRPGSRSRLREVEQQLGGRTDWRRYRLVGFETFWRVEKNTVDQHKFGGPNKVRPVGCGKMWGRRGASARGTGSHCTEASGPAGNIPDVAKARLRDAFCLTRSNTVTSMTGVTPISDFCIALHSRNTATLHAFAPLHSVLSSNLASDESVFFTSRILAPRLVGNRHHREGLELAAAPDRLNGNHPGRDDVPVRC